MAKNSMLQLLEDKGLTNVRGLESFNKEYEMYNFNRLFDPSNSVLLEILEEYNISETNITKFIANQYTKLINSLLDEGQAYKAEQVFNTLCIFVPDIKFDLQMIQEAINRSIKNKTTAYRLLYEYALQYKTTALKLPKNFLIESTGVNINKNIKVPGGIVMIEGTLKKFNQMKASSDKNLGYILANGHTDLKLILSGNYKTQSDIREAHSVNNVYGGGLFTYDDNLKLIEVYGKSDIYQCEPRLITVSMLAYALPDYLISFID